MGVGGEGEGCTLPRPGDPGVLAQAATPITMCGRGPELQVCTGPEKIMLEP